MDIEKIFKPIEPKRIPTPATEASQHRSINKLLGQIKTKINNFTPRGDHE